MGAGIRGALTRSGQWAAVALGFSIPLSVAIDNVLLAVIAAGWLATSGAWRETWHQARANAVAVSALVLFGLLSLGALHGVGAGREAGGYLSKYSDLLFIPVFSFLLRDATLRGYAVRAFAASLLLVMATSYLIAAGMPTAKPLLGTPGNPVVLKHYLTHGLLLAFGAFLFFHLALATASRMQRIGWLGAAFAAAVNVLFLVQSRTGYVILAALALYLGYGWLRWRGLAMAAAATAAALAVLAVIPGPFQQRFGLVEGTGPGSVAERWAKVSNAERLEMYRVTLGIVRDHPLVGVGTGGFPAAYAQRAAGGNVTRIQNPHNQYLLIAAQLGLVGLAALLCLFAAHWWLAPRLASPLEVHLARGLVLTIAIGCLVNSLLLDHTEGLLYAWLTGVLFGGLQPPPAPSPATVSAATPGPC